MQNASAGAQQTNLLDRHNIGVVLLSSARGHFDVGDKHQRLASPTGNPRGNLRPTRLREERFLEWCPGAAAGVERVNELTIANPGFVGGSTVSPLQKTLAGHVCHRVTMAVDGRAF
jgi:hypothetical protein